jgi:hypothetical protein
VRGLCGLIFGVAGAQLFLMCDRMLLKCIWQRWFGPHWGTTAGKTEAVACVRGTVTDLSADSITTWWGRARA